jgi:glycosyltransferase involved in cell wall biosynthesis
MRAAFVSNMGPLTCRERLSARRRRQAMAECLGRGRRLVYTVRLNAPVEQGMASISVIIPSYNPLPQHLETLHRSLLAQTLGEFEVVVVDDASDRADYSMLTDPRFRVVRRDHRSGPAACRNAGATEASGDRIFFTDTDCELAPETLEIACRTLETEGACTGNTVTKVRTPFGRTVALLGFPGGGSIGFDRVWRVDGDGYARSFSSCNLGMRRDVFDAAGRFDESFPVPGGEDTVLARHMVDRGMKIRYVPAQVVYHVEKDTLRGFVRWQITRGRGNYHIKRRVPNVGGYLRLRVWTFSNSLKAAGPLYALPVLALIAASVALQSWGFWLESRNQGEHHG